MARVHSGPRLGRPPDHHIFGMIRHDLIADGPLDGAPPAPMGADARQDVGRRRGPAVGQDAGRLDHPLVAVPAPEARAMAALRVEDPRLDLSRRRVPADPLVDGHDRLPLDVDVKSRSRKFWSSVHRQVVCTTESGLSSSQSPTSHASSWSR